MLSHAQVWSAIDALARARGLSASALAKSAGLDPTSFNRSKRVGADGRERWPSTESLAKVLAATGASLADFAALAGGGAGARRQSPGVPLMGLAQAGEGRLFDDTGFAAAGAELVAAPQALEGAYAIEVTGDSMAPAYRDGDRLVVRPTSEPPRPGQRVVVRTTGGEVLAKEVARVTARRLELRSLNPDYPGRTLERSEIAWVARVLWASQ